nr:MAG TPA: hypothetical protein [Caudoviricetes sp.]
MASCSCRHYLQSSKRLSSIIVSDLQIFSKIFIIVSTTCSRLQNDRNHKNNDNTLLPQ